LPGLSEDHSCLSSCHNFAVITGYNTDIEHEGVTYHVQTEDKGLSKPLIVSLVYNGGTILASKRQPYDDLLVGGFDEQALAERLKRQHKLICAAIRAGRIDDLRRMSEKEPAKEPVAAVVTSGRGAAATAAERPVPKPRSAEPVLAKPSKDVFDTIPDAITLVEEVVVPDELVKVVAEPPGRKPKLTGKLSIELIGDDKFRGGEARNISVLICRGRNHKVVSGAQVMVKVLGSAFRPLIFHAKTDQNGLASAFVEFPRFASGRGVILIRALHDGEEVELRRVVDHG
jgi:hypothetical protein